jgi:hypothetical protein
MLAREALSKALVMVIEGEPVIRVLSGSQRSDADDWRIELRYPDGSYKTIRELPSD